jgi:hypothetical protein
MSRRSKEKIQRDREEARARREREEIENTREKLKENPLYRENRRVGINYDTGEPFREAAFYLVHGHYKNIVVRTSAGRVIEATSKYIKFRNIDDSEPMLVEEFNPDPNSGYPYSAPFYTKVSSNLSNLVTLALSRLESVTIEMNVASPFKEDSI